MSLLDDLKAKADQNGDGKLTLADLEKFKDKLPKGRLDELKKLADRNGDGKVSFDDIKSIDFGDLLSDAKNEFGSLFGK